MANGTDRADGILILEVRAKPGVQVVAVRGLLTRLVVGTTDGASPLFARRIAIDGREKTPFEFRVPVPVGEYGKLTLGLAELVLTTVDNQEERVVLARGDSTFSIALKISAKTPGRAILYLHLDGLRRAKAPGDVLAPVIDDGTPRQALEALRSEAATLLLEPVGLDLGPRPQAGCTRVMWRVPSFEGPWAGLRMA
jgi:hypothetical protein